MYKQSKAMPPASGSKAGFETSARRFALRLLLSAPLCALAGVNTTGPATRPAAGAKAEPSTEIRPAQKSAATAPAKPGGPYQIRCWQYGRLLFEENLAALPADNTKYSIKVAGSDRKGQPMYVAETSNATCLIRSAPGERAWPAAPSAEAEPRAGRQQD